jgi:hypothetical protein
VSSIESLLCFYSSLVEEMFELGICDLLGIIVIKVRSKAVILFFSEIDTLFSQQIFSLLHKLLSIQNTSFFGNEILSLLA